METITPNKPTRRKNGARMPVYRGSTSGGKMTLYNDFRTLQKRIDEYFAKRDEEQKPYTIYGFCTSVGLTFRELQQIMSGNGDILVSLLGEGKTAQIVAELKKGVNRLGDAYETALQTKSSLQIGHIFLLKQLGMSDTPDKVTIKGADNQPLTVNIIKYNA